jgi:hypothetical protein
LSSILTALKKLENQAKSKSPVGFEQQQNQQQNPPRQRLSDHLHANKRYLFILAGLIFVSAAGIALNKKVRYNNQKVATEIKFAAKKETRPQSPARLLDKKQALANRVEKKSLPQNQIKEPVRTKKEAEMPSAPLYTSRAVPPNVPGKETLPSKKTEKETIAGKSEEKHEPYVKPGRFAGIPVKRSNETEIEIQAIAWSKDPTNRLAVINGLILREGESIDNVAVVDIGKDAVVFEKGGQKWKQLFGF